jgi:WD40 repeat protein
LVLALGKPGHAEPPQKEEKGAENHRSRTDLYGDPLPAGSVARMGTIRWRLDRQISFAAALTSDGKTLVAANPFRGLCCWDMGTGKIIHRVPEDPQLRLGENSFSSSLTFSTDANVLACGEPDGTIRIVNPFTGKERNRLIGHQAMVNSLAVTSDGRSLISRSMDNTVRLWDLGAGKEVRKFPIPSGERDYMSLAISPDGKTFSWINNSDLSIRIWDPIKGRELERLRGHKDTIQRIAFSNDGKKLVSTGNDAPVRLWDPATGQQVRALQGKDRMGWVYAVFSPDGKTLVTSRYSEPIQLWDLATGNELWKIPAHPQGDHQMIFTPDSKTLVVLRGQFDSLIHRYDTVSGKEMPALGHTSSVNSMTFLPGDRMLVSLGEDNQSFRLWETSTGKPLRQEALQQELIKSRDLAFSFDRRKMALAQDETIHLCETETGKKVGECKERRGQSIYRLAFSPLGKVLVSAAIDGNTGDNHVTLWNVDTRKELRSIPLSSFIVYNFAFTPDGRTLIVNTKGPGESELAGGVHGNHLIQFLEVSTGRKRRSFVLPPSGALWRALSPTGKTLVLPGKETGTVCFWETATGQLRLQLKQPSFIPTAVFSPNGKMVLTAGYDGLIRFWDARNGRLLGESKGHHGEVSSLAFSGTGRQLASGSWDTTILVWNLAELPGPQSPLAQELNQKDLASYWADLMDADASKAYQAIWKLAQAPEQTLTFMKERLRPVSPVDPQRLTKLLADLDSNLFSTRERAAKELEEIGDLAELALRKSLQSKPTPEVRRRVEQLLEKLEKQDLQADVLRSLRAVEVLEEISSPESKKMLQALSRGASEARLTQEAMASLERLSKRSSVSP